MILFLLGLLLGIAITLAICFVAIVKFYKEN